MSPSAEPGSLPVLISRWIVTFAAPARELHAGCEIWGHTADGGPFEVRISYNEQRVSTIACVRLTDAEAQSHDLLHFLKNRGWN